MRAWGILFLGLAVPLVLLTMKKERALVAWICLTVGINIFDARVGINFAAARVAGLLLIAFAPFGVYRIGFLLRTRPMQFLALQIAYLAALGAIFGFVIPWPNNGFLRSMSQEAHGRVIIYMLRMLADIGILLFIARQVLQGMNPRYIVKYLLAGTAVAAAGGLLEVFSHIQLYQLITGYPINEVADRVRGFNFEPRGLGLVMAHGAFFSLIWNAYRPSTPARMLVLAHTMVLLLSVSASAVLAAAAMLIALFVAEPRVRRPSLVAGALGAAAGALLILYWGQTRVAQSWMFNLGGRFSLDDLRTLSGTVDIQTIVAFLDIFDYTAAMFLISAPLSALVGTGPGLVVLPGSSFIPAISRWSWVGQGGEGITSLPSMGVLLELSNGGVVGLFLWICMVAAGYRALSAIRVLEDEASVDWSICRAAFVVAVAGYALQVSPLSAFLPIFLGLAVGAAGRLHAAGASDSPAPALRRLEVSASASANP